MARELSITAQMKLLAANHGAKSGFLSRWLTNLSDDVLNELCYIGAVAIDGDATGVSGFADFLGCVFGLLAQENMAESCDITYEDLSRYHCPALGIIVTFEQLRRAGIRSVPSALPNSLTEAVAIMRRVTMADARRI